MSRLFCIFLVCLAVFLTGCNAQPNSRPLEIIPSKCSLKPGERTTFSIKGVIGSNPTISWQATDGLIQAQDKDGLVAIFTAPQAPGVVEINVNILSNLTPSKLSSVSCVILAGDPTATLPMATVSVKPDAKPAEAPTILISEVMAHQCGADDFKKFNQYVELYNYGDEPVDVNGWWLADNGPDNQADRLVAWVTRNPRAALKPVLVSDTTLIPPHGFAVILSPIYHQSVEPYKLPYRFPNQTIILTVAESDRIGDDLYGLVGHSEGRDVVVLYLGGRNSIQKVISTYGTPLLGAYPQDIRDDRADSLPLDLHECASAERINPLGPDEAGNWREVLDGSPGEAPY